MSLYLIKDSVTSFSLLIATESESELKAETEAIWYWNKYFGSKNKNPIEIERINTPGIVWLCTFATSD